MFLEKKNAGLHDTCVNVILSHQPAVWPMMLTMPLEPSALPHLLCIFGALTELVLALWLYEELYSPK